MSTLHAFLNMLTILHSKKIKKTSSVLSSTDEVKDQYLFFPSIVTRR